ncbi:hypothetical protein VOLCADRAFT_56541, partial [Volvox carteri f. nagariensis]
VVGRVSDWIQPDSPDPAVRQQSVAALQHQLGWAAHLGLQAVVLPTPHRPAQSPNYAQVLNQALQGLTHMALWLTVPLVLPHEGGEEGEDAKEGTAVDGWEAWHQVRAQCDHNNLLGAALLVGPVLPSAPSLERWRGEPVKAVLLPTSVFTSNKRGYPVLPRPHQDLLAGFFKLGVQVRGGRGEEDGGGGRALGVCQTHNHSRYIYLYGLVLFYLYYKLSSITTSPNCRLHHLPRQDNLESQTYETFEKDVQKYKLYEEAVYKALKDRRHSSSTPATTTTINNNNTRVVLMVVGAGRGPLVRASMRAAARASVRLRVYAVEKNPNAIVHIQQMLRSEGWESDVTIVSADMRHWQAPEPAEILVSELLGSFGDNELSPECLDGAQRFLAPGGISIPQSYTSYIAPATSHKLHHDVKSYKDLEHFETPYVVRLHRHHLLAATQPLFTFSHPNNDTPIDNSRYATVTFVRDPAAGAAVLHGFAGYFECTLYGDVLLSIHPPTHSENMFSWFPIFFPLRETVYVPAGGSVGMQMWRCCAPHKVWYEWSVTAPVAGPIHNVGGRSYWVGL